MVEKHLRCYITYEQKNWADLLPFAEVAYNNAVHSSTGFTLYRVVYGMDFVPIPEWPQDPPFPSSLSEWADKIPEVWEDVKMALQKAAKIYKA